MRDQSRLKGNGLGNFCKRVWEETKFPLAVSALLGGITCTMVDVALGTSQTGVFLMSSIGGSYLVIPVLISAISYCLGSKDNL